MFNMFIFVKIGHSKFVGMHRDALDFYPSTLGFYTRHRVNIMIDRCLFIHCRQRAPVENVPSSSGTSHLGMIDIQATTKSKEDVVIGRLFLFVFTYMFRWLTSLITQIWIK